MRNTQRPGYHYGSAELTDHDGADALLGDLSVDADIDRLREVIGSVDSILGQCLSTSVRIGKTRRKENKLHLDVLRGIDSWEGHRGALVSQRALLSGVSVLEGGNDVSDECYESLKNNLSWQASLASAAVSAAEDVRSTVRASQTSRDISDSLAYFWQRGQSESAYHPLGVPRREDCVSIHIS